MRALLPLLPLPSAALVVPSFTRPLSRSKSFFASLCLSLSALVIFVSCAGLLKMGVTAIYVRWVYVVLRDVALSLAESWRVRRDILVCLRRVAPGSKLFCGFRIVEVASHVLK